MVWARASRFLSVSPLGRPAQPGLPATVADATPAPGRTQAWCSCSSRRAQCWSRDPGRRGGVAEGRPQLPVHTGSSTGPWPQPLCHKALGAAARGPRSLPPPSLTHSTKGQLPRVPSSLKPRSSRVEQGAQAPDTPGSASETADLGRGGWERASAGGCGGHAPSLHGVHQPPGAPRPGLPPGVVEMVLGCLSLPGRGQGHHKALRCGQERTCPECAGLGGAGGLRTANLAPGPSADVPGSWG